MADTANSDNLVFGLGNEMERCPKTGRAYEVGSGALPHDQQTENFVRESDRAGTRPIEGERCVQTGREYECGSGSLSKERQTANFLDKLSPADKAQRAEAASALNAVLPAGTA
jgi:hypothetical protein